MEDKWDKENDWWMNGILVGYKRYASVRTPFFRFFLSSLGPPPPILSYVVDSCRGTFPPASIAY